MRLRYNFSIARCAAKHRTLEQRRPHTPEQRSKRNISEHMAIEAETRVTSATAHGKNGRSLISNAKFRQLYELALKLRLASDREEQLRGREAALAGVAADLRESDVIASPYAASVDDIARGHAMAHIDRRSFEERVIEAMSDAVSDRMRKTGRVTAIFFDRMQDSSVLQEARVLAIVAKLPVLFVEHGLDKPKKSGSMKRRTPAAIEYPSIPVDTLDVIAVYRVAHESIARARDGGGPTHIVRVPWQPAASRRKAAAKPETQDAVEHLEEWLIARGLPVQEWRREIVAAFETYSDEHGFGAQNAADRVIEDDDTETRAIA